MTAPTAPRRARRSLRRRLLFVAVLLVGLWLVLEAAAAVGWSVVHGERFSFRRVHAAQAARVHAAPGPAPGAARSDSLTCIHPYLGFVADRDTDDQMLATAGGHGVTRWGFIDDQGPVRRRDPRKVLIGIFGGSVAQYFGEEGASELAARLRAHPDFRDRRIEFVRCGLIGFKQPQQLFALAYVLALGGELDIAINLDGVNEATLTAENVQRGVPEFFPRNWSLIAEAAPDPVERRLVGTVTMLRSAQASLAAAFGEAPWRWSIAAGLLWQGLDGWLERAATSRLLQLQQRHRDDLPFHVRGPGVGATDAEAVADASTRMWAHCSRTMHSICAANGIRYHHFLQPNQYLEGSKELNAEELRRGFLADAWQRPWIQRTYPRMRASGAELAAAGVRFHDLTQVFAGVADTIYVDECCHVNAAGNRLLARAIAAGILKDSGAEAAAARAPLTELRIEPSEVHLTRPLSTVEVRVLGTRSDGQRDDVTYAGTEFTSSDPSVVAVDGYGTLTAVGAGEATVEARCGDRRAVVRVGVRFPRVVDLGGAFAPRPLHRPVLQASEAGGRLTLRVTPPGDGLPGAVSFAVTPMPRPLCGGLVVVPLLSPHVEPLAASAGELQVRFVPPGPQPRTVYVQAVYRVGLDRCGFAVSNALAITP